MPKDTQLVIGIAKTQASATSLHHAPILKVKRLRLRRTQRCTHPESTAVSGESKIQTQGSLAPDSAWPHPIDSSISRKCWHLQEVPGLPWTGWRAAGITLRLTSSTSSPGLSLTASPGLVLGGLSPGLACHTESAPQPRAPRTTSQNSLRHPFTLHVMSDKQPSIPPSPDPHAHCPMPVAALGPGLPVYQDASGTGPGCPASCPASCPGVFLQGRERPLLAIWPHPGVHPRSRLDSPSTPFPNACLNGSDTEEHSG